MPLIFAFMSYDGYCIFVIKFYGISGVMNVNISVPNIPGERAHDYAAVSLIRTPADPKDAVIRTGSSARRRIIN